MSGFIRKKSPLSMREVGTERVMRTFNLSERDAEAFISRLPTGSLTPDKKEYWELVAELVLEMDDRIPSGMIKPDHPNFQLMEKYPPIKELIDCTVSNICRFVTEGLCDNKSVDKFAEKLGFPPGKVNGLVIDTACRNWRIIMSMDIAIFQKDGQCSCGISFREPLLNHIYDIVGPKIKEQLEDQNNG